MGALAVVHCTPLTRALNVSAKREVYCKDTLDAPHMNVRGSGRADVAIVDAVLVPINAPGLLHMKARGSSCTRSLRAVSP